jgi:hypothetical protein
MVPVRKGSTSGQIVLEVMVAEEQHARAALAKTLQVKEAL